VLHDDVGALIDERLGGVGLLGGIEPGVDPDDLDLDVGLTDWAPSMVALMPMITSGIGNDTI